MVKLVSAYLKNEYISDTKYDDEVFKQRLIKSL